LKLYPFPVYQISSHPDALFNTICEVSGTKHLLLSMKETRESIIHSANEIQSVEIAIDVI